MNPLLVLRGQVVHAGSKEIGFLPPDLIPAVAFLRVADHLLKRIFLHLPGKAISPKSRKFQRRSWQSDPALRLPSPRNARKPRTGA